MNTDSLIFLFQRFSINKNWRPWLKFVFVAIFCVFRMKSMNILSTPHKSTFESAHYRACGREQSQLARLVKHGPQRAGKLAGHMGRLI